MGVWDTAGCSNPVIGVRELRGGRRQPGELAQRREYEFWTKSSLGEENGSKNA